MKYLLLSSVQQWKVAVFPNWHHLSERGCLVRHHYLQLDVKYHDMLHHTLLYNKTNYARPMYYFPLWACMHAHTHTLLYTYTFKCVIMTQVHTSLSWLSNRTEYIQKNLNTHTHTHTHTQTHTQTHTHKNNNSIHTEPKSEKKECLCLKRIKVAPPSVNWRLWSTAEHRNQNLWEKKKKKQYIAVTAEFFAKVDFDNFTGEAKNFSFKLRILSLLIACTGYSLGLSRWESLLCFYNIYLKIKRWNGISN